MAMAKAAGFGLDDTELRNADWRLAAKRILHDARSDFIYAPHLSFVYRKASEELASLLAKELKDGTYNPGLPITIEVPKSFRIKVASTIRRLGPAFSRPGSILLPRDRLLYQILADKAAPYIEAKTDVSRSFSHRLGPTISESMFLPTRNCWNALQKALAKLSLDSSVRYVLKLDVANFFGALNQHTLVNRLQDAGYPKSLGGTLERLLPRYAGERSSRGILQGMYPSDLFGNFYLDPVDEFLAEYDVPSARYVDDLYIFLPSVTSAERLMRDLTPTLRSYDLALNEHKSTLMPKSALVTEEPDLELLFEAAVSEVSEQVEDDDFDADYGFQTEWEDDDVDSEGLELKATTILFDAIDDYTGHEENIERFCLPLFAKAGSDYAVPHVKEVFKRRPAMAQIYCAYLVKSLDDPTVEKFIVSLLSDDGLVDWQKMWVLAALSQRKHNDDPAVKSAFDLFRDGNRHDALRAVAAIFVGRFGSHSRRKALASAYGSVSAYVQSSIYYSSRLWPPAERNTASASWGNDSALHELITIAISKK